MYTRLFEAGRALFEAATSDAWEALVTAFFSASTNFLQDYLWDWIPCLTDLLSGGITSCPEQNYGIEADWFSALLTEVKTEL